MKIDAIQVQQWLTDIALTKAEAGLDEGFDKAEKHAKNFLKNINEFRNMYKLKNDNLNLEKINNIEIKFKEYYEIGIKMANEYISKGTNAGNPLYENI